MRIRNVDAVDAPGGPGSRGLESRSMDARLKPAGNRTATVPDRVHPDPVPDGMLPLAAIYGLWIAFAAECVGALILVRGPLESVLAAVFSYRNRYQLDQRFRFEASYLLAEILIGGAFFALAIVAEYWFRTTSAWAYTYQRPFYPELFSRFLRMALVPLTTVLVGFGADLLVLNLG